MSRYDADLEIQTCTRPEPHICTVNGPCNGWPKVSERQQTATSVSTDKAERLRFIQDDSGHWYAIPGNKRDAFERWVASFDDSANGDCSEGNFDQYRLGMHPTNYTFLNLVED